MVEHQPQVDEVFGEALRHAAGPDRIRYLAETCGDNLELRRRVERLLRAVSEAGSFLEAPAQDPSPTVDQPPVENPGVTIGPYKLLGLIGEGGMGMVWMAQQTRPVKRLVAVKLIKAGMDSKQIIARFEAERQALALMDHPNIAKVLDAGTTPPSPPSEGGEVFRPPPCEGEEVFKPHPFEGGEVFRSPPCEGGEVFKSHPSEGKEVFRSLPCEGGVRGGGRPYFVMELVKGVPITKYCDEHHLTPRQRLELFVPVCQAIQHAHQKGIIHRDLKPSNVLVALYDGKPVPKVIDFGVAKAMGQPLTEQTLVTGFGAIIGTLEYMSPEQAEINQLDIDTRSDIYSLGVLLYELLTGTTPLEHKRVKESGLIEALRIIREEEVPTLSNRLSSTAELPAIAANRGTEPAKLTRLVRGELDWIVMKALEKDRNRRYETANEFAMDVQRYLADEPVQAGPPSASYRLRKFTQRHRGLVLAASLIALVLVVGIIGTTSGMLWAMAAEQRAVRERDAKDNALNGEMQARSQTRQALNTLTDAVVEDLLGRQTQLTQQHRDFLKKILAHHEAFAAAKADDPNGLKSRAEGYGHVAGIRYRLGEVREAEQAYREALKLWTQIGSSIPECEDAVAETLMNLGTLLRDTGQAEGAETAYREALAIQQGLVARIPDRAALREDLARTHYDLGILLAKTGRPKEAEENWRQTLAIRQQLAADYPQREAIRHELATVHTVLGGLLQQTGRLPEAEEAHREAVALLTRLAEDFPSDPRHRQALSISHNNLGLLLRQQGRIENAEVAYRAALSIEKKLTDDFPSRPEFRSSLAMFNYNLGVLLHTNGRSNEAEPAWRDAIALLRQLAADFPAVPEHRDLLAATITSLGNLLRATGRRQDAEAAQREAIDLLKKLVRDTPDRPGSRDNLAQAYNNLGMLMSASRPDEAESAFCEALVLRRQLCAELPKVPTFQKQLADTLNNQANLFVQRADHAAAVPLLDQARALLQGVLKASPNDPSYRLSYRNNLALLATAHLGVANHEHAAACAGELVRFGYDAPNDTYSAATFLSRCIPLADKAEWPDQAQRKELARAYADRALVLLRQAVQCGFKNVDHLKQDPDLEPIRGREEFKQLLAEMEK